MNLVILPDGWNILPIIQILIFFAPAIEDEKNLIVSTINIYEV